MGWVYFIREGADGPIKIGRTSVDVRGRMGASQTSTHHQLALIGQVPESLFSEKELHERFSELRIRGEWFKPSAELLAAVDSMCEGRRPEEPHTFEAPRQPRNQTLPAARAHGPTQMPVRPDDAFRAMAEALAPHIVPLVAEHIRRMSAADAPVGLVSVDTALGVTRRHVGTVCRAGRIPGAVLVGRRWRAPQSGIDAYIASCRGARQRTVADDDENITADDVLRELGWTR